MKPPNIRSASKWLIRLVLLALCLLIMVLLVNTRRFDTRQIQVSVAPVRCLDDDAVVVQLRQAVRFRTVSYQNSARIEESQFQAFHDYLATTYPRVHQALDRFTGEQLGDPRNLSLLFRWQGPRANRRG